MLERKCTSSPSVCVSVCVCVCVSVGLVGSVDDSPSAPRSLTSFHTDRFSLFSEKSACDGERKGRLRGMDNECDV